MSKHSAVEEEAVESNVRRTPTSLTVRILTFLFLVVVLGVATAVGTRLVEVPPALPSGLWEWIEVVFGAILLVFIALLVPFVPRIVRTIANVIAGHPRNSDEEAILGTLRKFRDGLKRGGVIATVVITLAAFGVIAWVWPSQASPGIEPGNLKIMSAFDESPLDPRRMLLEQWDESHPNNTVEVIDAPGEPDEQHEHFVNDAKEDGSHQADVYLLDIVWMAEFIDRNMIKPLDESRRTSADSDYVAKALETNLDSFGNRPGLWGLPLNTDAGLLFSRSDLVDARGFTRWGDYFGESAKDLLDTVRNAPTLPRDRTEKLVAANAAQLANEEVLTVTALEAIWAHGGEVVNPDGKLVLDQSGSVRFDNNALEGLKDLAASASVPGPGITQPDARSTDEDKAVATFGDGRTLFMRNWPIAYDKLRQSSDQATNPFAVTELPHPSVLGGQNLAISNWTSKPRAAQDLIEFLTNPSSQMILFDIGGFAPTHRTVYERFPGAIRPYLSTLLSAVQDARVRPVTPCYTTFTKEFRTFVYDFIDNPTQPGRLQPPTKC